MRFLNYLLFIALSLGCGQQSAINSESNSIIGTWKRDCHDTKVVFMTFDNDGSHKIQKYRFKNQACEGPSELVYESTGTYRIESKTLTEIPQPFDLMEGTRTEYVLIRLTDGKMQISDVSHETLGLDGRTPETRLTKFGSRYYVKQ